MEGNLISREDKKIKIFKILIITSLFLAYFVTIFIIFKPNIPTHISFWNDNYCYRLVAYNFAKYSKLEDSYFFSQSVIYGKFPSAGYHSTLFSFLIGLVLKIFNNNTSAFFLLNYLLTAGMFITMYFYSKKRLENKYLYLFLTILAIFPIILIFSNVIMMETLFIFLVPFIYYLFFKNVNNKFNIWHIIFLFLLAMVLAARYSYIFLIITLLLVIYIYWGKNKNIFKIILSFFIFTSLSFALIKIFNSNLAYYPVWPKSSTYWYISSYGFKSTFTKEFWVVLTETAVKNITRLIDIMKSPLTSEGSLHWLLFLILASNLVFLIKSKNKKITKELALILIPEFIILISSILIYSVVFIRHLRPIFGFIPLNLLYIFTYFKNLNIKIRNIILIILIPILMFTSFNWCKTLYIDKNVNSPTQIESSVWISDIIKKYKDKDRVIIASDFNEMWDVIYNYNIEDKCISMNHFTLSEKDFTKLIQKDFIDIWIIDKNGYIAKNNYLKYLDNSSLFIKIEQNNNQNVLIYKRSN